MIVQIETVTEEQRELLQEFVGMLNSVSKDGGRKRAAGAKQSWKIDQSHEAAIFSHLNKWKHGELADPDSGQHPLVHLAWRALAIAWQERLAPVDSDATGYKEDLAYSAGLKTSMAGVGGMAHEGFGPNGVALTANERAALWNQSHHAYDRAGNVLGGGA